MELGMIISLIFVIVCPFAYAFVNIFDKYVVSYRIKRPLGISALSFIPLSIVGLILVFFSNWTNTSPRDLISPIIGGVMVGVQYFVYYWTMRREDASSFSGMTYFYPVIVALMSFLILNERLGLISYIGLAVVTFGVVKLSMNSAASKSKSFFGFFLILINILLIAVYEFSAKITTTNLPIINGIAVTTLVSGLAIIPFIGFKNIRKDFFFEMRNLKWVFAAEAFTLFATVTLFLALWNLSATIVSAIASVQPLIVLFYERIAEKKLSKISKHRLLFPKLIPIILIILGVIALYIEELIK
jgi:drug/metabolite transporter (DMT)-like permease